MTLQDIIIKIALFFLLFYGAIFITAVVAKKIRKGQEEQEEEIK